MNVDMMNKIEKLIEGPELKQDYSNKGYDIYFLFKQTQRGVGVYPFIHNFELQILFKRCPSHNNNK